MLQLSVSKRTVTSFSVSERETVGTSVKNSSIKTSLLHPANTDIKLRILHCSIRNVLFIIPVRFTFKRDCLVGKQTADLSRVKLELF